MLPKSGATQETLRKSGTKHRRERTSACFRSDSRVIFLSRRTGADTRFRFALLSRLFPPFGATRNARPLNGRAFRSLRRSFLAILTGKRTPSQLPVATFFHSGRTSLSGSSIVRQ